MDAITRSLRRMIKGSLPALAISLAAVIGPAGAQDVPEWQSLLEKVVNINSGTRNVEGLDAVRQVLVPEFEKLGMEVAVEPLAEGTSCYGRPCLAATPRSSSWAISIRSSRRTRRFSK